jgi:hypothetical protein
MSDVEKNGCRASPTTSTGRRVLEQVRKRGWPGGHRFSVTCRMSTHVTILSSRSASRLQKNQQMADTVCTVIQEKIINSAWLFQIFNISHFYSSNQTSVQVGEAAAQQAFTEGCCQNWALYTRLLPWNASTVLFLCLCPRKFFFSCVGMLCRYITSQKRVFHNLYCAVTTVVSFPLNKPL